MKKEKINYKAFIEKIAKYSKSYILPEKQAELKEDLDILIGLASGNTEPAGDVLNILKILTLGSVGQAVKYRSGLPSYCGKKNDDETNLNNALVWVYMDSIVYKTSAKGKEYIDNVLKINKVECNPELLEGLKPICEKFKITKKEQEKEFER